MVTDSTRVLLLAVADGVVDDAELLGLWLVSRLKVGEADTKSELEAELDTR